MVIDTKLSLQWILNSIGLATAFIIGLFQYIKAQRREKMALLLPLINEFETDEELKAACHLIDYDGGMFILNEKIYEFDNGDLFEAMKVVKWDQEWSPSQEAIREVLDRFFDFFEKLYSFVEIKLISFDDLNYFYYYFELLTNIKTYKGKYFEDRLKEYLQSYNFNGCQKCISAYQQLPTSRRQKIHLPQENEEKTTADPEE